MSTKPQTDPTMRIAPKRSADYWTVQDWQDAQKANDWPKMFQIFKDRLDYHFLSAARALIEADKRQPTRRFGFSIMALDCLFIETLAQFYQGLKTSEDARSKEGHHLGNTEFYIGFLRRDSCKLKDVFDTDPKARLFYKTIRCGILHQGETTGGSKIVTTGSDIMEDMARKDCPGQARRSASGRPSSWAGATRNAARDVDHPAEVGVWHPCGADWDAFRGIPGGFPA